MSTPIETRLETAVLSKLPESLARIQADLEDMGATFVDARQLESVVRGELVEYMSGKAPDDLGDRSLLSMGEDEASSPAALARTMVAFGLRRAAKDWLEMLDKIEKAEDAKIMAWASRKVGRSEDELSVVFGQLAIVTKLGVSDQVLEWMRISRMVLEESPEKLAGFVSKVPASADGERGFIRDIASAILSGPRMEQLVRDMWDAADPAAIDAVLEHSSVTESEHANVLGFYGRMLKEVLALSGSERAQVWKAVGRK